MRADRNPFAALMSSQTCHLPPNCPCERCVETRRQKEAMADDVTVDANGETYRQWYEKCFGAPSVRTPTQIAADLTFQEERVENLMADIERDAARFRAECDDIRARIARLEAEGTA
jgi:hypothetical protein